MNLEMVAGLEVHAELLTSSKMFCGCPNIFGSPANTQTCPVCLGMPGVLPVINKKALELAIRLALVVQADILPVSLFDRKNYYYPDLPKNYQISQNYYPFCRNGYIEIEIDGKKKKVGLDNIHLEEDAGKNLHSEDTGLKHHSLVDLNRAGVPLLEIVSKPDMSSIEEVEAYMLKLKSILEYLEVSDCKMQEGSLRFEANISIKKTGDPNPKTWVEIKNLNSFKTVFKSLNYEQRRQTELIKEGKPLLKETRLWNDENNMTIAMRGKEKAHDYRYFPEPDLAPLNIDKSWVEEIKSNLPELPQQKKERFITQYSLREYDASILTADKIIADFFEETVKIISKPKIVSNWIMGELLKELKLMDKNLEDIPLTPKKLAELLSFIVKEDISGYNK
jgi:aspartyl-tRNA(Asn)/glutamyl-tRNA(Gln) amidotransferase subunit B